MQTSLTINGIEFTPYIAEGGLQYSTVERAAKSVETIDGTLYSSSVEKRALTVQLIELRGSTLHRLFGSMPNLTKAVYDEKNGSKAEKIFYFKSPSWTAKKVRGGNTYYSGVSFTLEER